MYCIECRNLHRERTKGDNIDLPLCDKTGGKKCEVVRSWQDTAGGKHTTPFRLYKSNHLPMELYERITDISGYAEYEGKKKKGHYPKLDAIRFIMDTFAPPDMDIDEMDSLLQKILLIHNLKFSNFLHRLNN